MSQIFTVRYCDLPTFRAHVAKTRAILLERETSELEARYVRLLGMGKREWRVDPTVVAAAIIGLGGVFTCLLQLGGAL